MSIFTPNNYEAEGQLFINDEIINNYMSLIQTRSPDTVYTFNTFFYLTFSTQGYKRVDRWTKKIDIFAKKKLFIPIHIREDNHWVLVYVDFENKTINYYDSIGNSGYDFMKVIVSYLRLEGVHKKNMHFCFDKWRLRNVKDCPQQQNHWDCGVFLCAFAEHLSRNAPLNFSQDDMINIRRQILLDIKKKKLKKSMPKS
ncbi:Hypothetical protein CINCED_3A000641 [Cinara cedri]|uniref:Ubiquitin-like protease family profile domain-containing protein n=1 Tax=Cinara cedri TaxID=506608 RepID=A0A5E4M0V7_9HEMI|nr:Hypothetical protein CINCED_3A000641 [Cinara cedri]